MDGQTVRMESGICSDNLNKSSEDPHVVDGMTPKKLACTGNSTR